MENIIKEIKKVTTNCGIIFALPISESEGHNKTLHSKFQKELEEEIFSETGITKELYSRPVICAGAGGKVFFAIANCKKSMYEIFDEVSKALF